MTGADVNLVDAANKSALQRAQAQQKKDTVAFLQSAGDTLPLQPLLIDVSTPHDLVVFVVSLFYSQVNPF